MSSEERLCELCGVPLKRGSKRFHRAFYQEWWREEVAKKASAAGNAKLAELRERGEDPAHGGKAAKSRSAKIARSNSLKPRKAPPEEWRPVVGYEGLYSVSDRGRVRSEERETRPGRVLKAKILKVGVSGSSGYPNVLLSPGLGDYGPESVRQPKSFLVSRLVAEAFIGPRPEGAFLVPIDGDPKNTAASNLRYAIGSYKLTQAQSREVVQMVEGEGKTKAEAARKFEVSYSVITRIIENHRKMESPESGDSGEAWRLRDWAEDRMQRRNDGEDQGE